MKKYEKGKIVTGCVTGIEKYGVFVGLDEFYSGLIHISEISYAFVKDIHDFVQIGEVIYAEVLDVDEKELHVKLSIKNIHYCVKNPTRVKNAIEETSLGFRTLAKYLPFWIDEGLKKSRKIINPIDK